MTLTKQFKNALHESHYYLLLLFAFSLPLSTAAPFFISLLLVINRIIAGNFKDDFVKLKENSFIKAILLFLLFMSIALLWSDDLKHGLMFTLRKEYKLLLIPIFMFFIQKQHIKHYLFAFLLGMSLSEFFTYLVYFELIAPFGHAKELIPTPFISHITYSPMLAFAIYILLAFLLFDKELSSKKKILYLFFVLTMTLNLFIAGGRAGQVMFFAVVSLLFFQYFSHKRFLAFLASLLVIPTLFFLLYNTLPNFQKRVDSAYSDVVNFNTNRNSSVGLRMNFALNSYEIFKKSPVFGVGTGGFKDAYYTVNKKNTPHLIAIENPHNMYTFLLVEFGIVGLAIFLSIFFFQIKYALKLSDPFLKNLAFATPLLFLLIMLSESYLLISNTMFLYILLSVLLYRTENIPKL